MRVDITGRHIDITPGLRELIDKSLARLERLLNDRALSAPELARQTVPGVREGVLRGRLGFSGKRQGAILRRAAATGYR